MNLEPTYGLLICLKMMLNISHESPRFSFDALREWCKFNFDDAINRDQIFAENLWFNSYATINGKPFGTRKFMKPNYQLSELINENFKFILVRKFAYKFSNLNFLDYIYIIEPIQRHWKCSMYLKESLCMPMSTTVKKEWICLTNLIKFSQNCLRLS